MKTKHSLTQEDWELFAREMADVKPLQSSDRVLHGGAKPPSPGQMYRRQAAQRALGRDENFLTTDFVEFVDRNAVLSFRRPGIQHGVFRKLERGEYPIEAVLDLHLMTVDEARTAMFEFIRDCMRYDVRSVLVNHGKSGRQPGKPATLKSYVARWLPQFEEVLAFHSAQGRDGGTGAVYVMLRKSEKRKQLTRQKLGITTVKPR
ncbi:MAG TPA: DNA endonuclease SmrA [Methylococcus sp.]|nr:DNA endonuclease SmrA [Methylococcus sp.]